MKDKGGKQQKRPGSVRIIGGKWRGRRLPVPDIEGLRPSGDRARETLFNWLQPYLHRARCVDLFAGTGVLGLEAVSRGAATAILVDKSASAVAAITGSIDLLGTDQVTAVRADAISWLDNQPVHSVDIILLDPPFGLALSPLVINRLENSDILTPRGLVYLESARADVVPFAAAQWEVLKEKYLGEVRMQVLQKK